MCSFFVSKTKVRVCEAQQNKTNPHMYVLSLEIPVSKLYKIL